MPIETYDGCLLLGILAIKATKSFVNGTLSSWVVNVDTEHIAEFPHGGFPIIVVILSLPINLS